MAQRFSAWFNANAYPWESYDESRERYEQQFGPIKEKKKAKSPEDGNRLAKIIAKKNNRNKPTEQKVEETSGFLDYLKDFNNMMPWDDTFQGFARGAVPGLDDQMASVGLIAGDTIAPTLEDLGLNNLGETVRQWGYDTYRENKKEAAEEEKKYPRPKSVEEELREADPNYRARTKTEIRKAGDSFEASILKTFPALEEADWYPSSEEFARDLPTSYDVGRTLTASGLPMVAAAGTAAVGFATGQPLLGALGAMAVGTTGGAALVSAEYSEQVRTNPVVRRSLGIDPDKPFDKLIPSNQQKLLRVASDAGRLTFGRRLTSSGIPEMLSYAPWGGRIFRAFLDVAGGTTSELLDIDVGEKAIVDALIRNGVPQDRALALQRSLREIGPEKRKVFTQTLVSEGIISSGFTSLEDATYGAASQQVDEAATAAKRQKEEKQKFEEGLQKIRRDKASKTDEIIKNAGVTVEHIEAMMDANDVEGATALFEHVKKAEPRMQNDVAELLMKKNPTVLWKIGQHLGDTEIMDKAIEANEAALTKAEKDQDKVEADKETTDQKAEEKKQKARGKRREKRIKEEEAAAAKVAEEIKQDAKQLKELEDARDAELAEAEAKKKKVPKVKPAKNIADLAKRWEDARLEGESYAFSPEDTEMLGDRVEFNEEVKKYKNTPKYVKANIPRLALKVATSKDPNIMDKLTMGELDFIEANQKQFDIEVAKIKEEGKPVTEVKEEVVEETKAEEVDIYDDDVRVPANLLFPGDKDAQKSYHEDNPDGMNWREYNSELIERKNDSLLDQGSDKDAEMDFGSQLDAKSDKDFLNALKKIEKQKAKAQPKIKEVDVDKFNAFADEFVENKIKGFERIKKKGKKKQKATKEMVKAWEAEAIRAWQAQQTKPKKSGVTTRSASTRTPKRGAFGLAVDEVKSLVTSFVGRNKKLKELGIKYHVISNRNKKDIKALADIEEAYFDSQDGTGEFAPENREAWVKERVADTLENAEGFIDDKTGEITIVTENITGDSATIATDRLVEVIFHETVGHHGLKKTLGDGLQLFLSRFRKTEAQRIRRYFTEGQGLGYLEREMKGVKEVKDRQKIWDGLSDKKKNDLTEEFIVKKFAEFGARDPDIINRMGVHIQRALNKQGWGRVGKNQVMMTLAEIQQEYIGGERNFWTGETFKPVAFRAGFLETGEEAEIEKVGLTPEEEYKATERMLREGKKKQAKVSTEPRPVEREPELMQEEYKFRNELYNQTLKGQVATHNESQDSTSLHAYVLGRLKNNRKVRGNKDKKPVIKNVAQSVANRIHDSLPDRNKWKKGKAFESVFKKAVEEETKANSKAVKAVNKDQTIKFSRKQGKDEKTRTAESRKASEEEGTPRLGTDYNSGKAPESFDTTPIPLAWLGDLEKNSALKEVTDNIAERFGSNGNEISERPLQFYNLDSLIGTEKNPSTKIDKLLKEKGFQYKIFSFDPANFKLPNFKKDSYHNGVVWIYDPNVAEASFHDADYTKAWRVTHELGHAFTEKFMHEKYGTSAREGRLGVKSVNVRGAPPKTTKVLIPALTLKEAQRAVEWEDVAFRAQRKILEDLGVKVSESDFAKEYNVNIKGALHRVLIGNFDDPIADGFKPNQNNITDLRGILELLEITENQIAEAQRKNPKTISREATAGIDLKTWEPVSDTSIIEAVDNPVVARKPETRKGIKALSDPSIDTFKFSRSLTDEKGIKKAVPKGLDKGRIRFSKKADTRDFRKTTEGTYEGRLHVEEDGLTHLVHWSPKSDLQETDTNFYGTGIKGEEMLGKRLYPKRFVPRTYYGAVDYVKEPGLGSYMYEVAVDPRTIYDIADDPDNIRQKVLDEVPDSIIYYYKGNKRLRSDPLRVTPEFGVAQEQFIKEAGYQGYNASGAVVMFYPTKVTLSRKQDGPYLYTPSIRLKVTDETKTLSGVKQSRSFGIYAKYNKEYKTDGTMLLHKNTIPDQGPYRITFFKADGELDTDRTENGHEHFPTLAKAKSRLEKVGEDRQDISGGRDVKMSRKVSTVDFDEMYVTEEGWDSVPPEVREKFEDGLITKDEAQEQTRIYPDVGLNERRHRLTERFFEEQGLEEIFPDVPSDITVDTYEVIDDQVVSVYTEAHPSRGTRKGIGQMTGYRVPKISKKTFRNPTLGELLDWEGDKGIKQSRKLATFTEELAMAEAGIDPIRFAQAAEKRVEEGEKVKGRRKTMVDRLTLSREYLEKKSAEGHGTPLGPIKLARKLPPEMLIEPQVIDSNAKKLSRKLVKRSADFSHSRMGDPAIFEWQDKLAHKLTRRLVSQGTLNDVEMYKELRRRNRGTILLAEQAGERLFKVLSKSEDQKALYDYFTTFNADKTKIKDETERKEAEAAKKKINDIGKALVKRGLMTEESLSKFGDQYLPRKYMKYLLSESDYAKISTGGADVKLDLSYLKKRLDIPQGIRELILGEVKDPAFLSSVAITAPLRDMAMLDWLEQIATVGTKEGRDWVLPATLVQFDTMGYMKKLAGRDTELIKQLQLYDTEGVNVSGHWLLNEADRLQDLIDNRLILTPEKEALVKGLIKKMKATGQKIAGVVLPKNYVKVPKGRKYGMLSGMAVRKEIFQDIWGSPSQGSFDVDDTGHISQSWAEKVLGTGGAFERYNRLWKWSKVSANPPSWVRNFVSNMIFMTLGPIPIHKVPFLFKDAIADQLKARYRQSKGLSPDPKSMTVLADKMGLTSGGFSQVELKMIRNSFAESQVKGDGVLGILNVRNAFLGFEKYVQRPTSDLYGGIDTLGKVMMLTHLKRKGFSDDRAAMEAEKWLFDYSNPLPSVKYLRKSAFGAPFLSYPSFVAPLMIETIIKRPWKFVPYFIFGELMTSLFKEQQDIDDEEWQATLETLPTYLRNKAVGGAITDKLFPKSVIPLWWPSSWGGSLDKLGRAQPIDIGYLQPWGMFTEVARELDPTKKGGWSPADATHSIGLLGAPILNIATTMLTNRDPFSDREIFDEFATQGEKAAAWFHYMFNLTMPPMMHGWTAGPGQGFGAIRRLIDAFDDTVVTREGEPKFTEGQAIARMFGMNVTPLAPHEARQKNAYFEYQKIQRLQRKIAHDYRSGVFQGLSKKELKEVVKKNVDKLNALVKDLKERLSKPLPESLRRSKLQKLRAREKFLKRLKTLKAG